jgi:hypothetical protein
VPVVPRKAPQSRAESRSAPYRSSNAPMPRTLTLSTPPPVNRIDALLPHCSPGASPTRRMLRAPRSDFGRRYRQTSVATPDTSPAPMSLALVPRDILKPRRFRIARSRADTLRSAARTGTACCSERQVHGHRPVERLRWRYVQVALPVSGNAVSQPFSETTPFSRRGGDRKRSPAVVVFGESGSLKVDRNFRRLAGSTEVLLLRMLCM